MSTGGKLLVLIVGITLAVFGFGEPLDIAVSSDSEQIYQLLVEPGQLFGFLILAVSMLFAVGRAWEQSASGNELVASFESDSKSVGIKPLPGDGQGSQIWHRLSIYVKNRSETTDIDNVEVKVLDIDPSHFIELPYTLRGAWKINRGDGGPVPLVEHPRSWEQVAFIGSRKMAGTEDEPVWIQDEKSPTNVHVRVTGAKTRPRDLFLVLFMHDGFVRAEDRAVFEARQRPRLPLRAQWFVLKWKIRSLFGGD